MIYNIDYHPKNKNEYAIFDERGKIVFSHADYDHCADIADILINGGTLPTNEPIVETAESLPETKQTETAESLPDESLSIYDRLMQSNKPFIVQSPTIAAQFQLYREKCILGLQFMAWAKNK